MVGLLGLAAEPLLHGLLEPFDLAAGGGVVGREFFWTMPRRRSSVSKPLRVPAPFLPWESRVVKTMPLSVSVEAGIRALQRFGGRWPARSVPVTRWWAVTVRA